MKIDFKLVEITSLRLKIEILNVFINQYYLQLKPRLHQNTCCISVAHKISTRVCAVQKFKHNTSDRVVLFQKSNTKHMCGRCVFLEILKSSRWRLRSIVLWRYESPSEGYKNFKKHSKCNLSNTFDQICVLYFLNVCSYEHTCCFMCFWAMNTTLVFCVYFWFRSPLTHVCPCVLQAKIIWPVWKNTCATCFRATLIINLNMDPWR